jgi:hypothetical protein
MKKIQDERIIQEKTKINSKAFGLALIFLWGMIIVRMYILKQDVGEYLDIFLLTIGLSIYVTINNVLGGYFLTYRSEKQSNKVIYITAVFALIAFAIVQIFILDVPLSSYKDILFLIMQSMIFTFVFVFVQIIFVTLSRKKANQDIE